MPPKVLRIKEIMMGLMRLGFSNPRISGSHYRFYPPKEKVKAVKNGGWGFITVVKSKRTYGNVLVKNLYRDLKRIGYTEIEIDEAFGLH
jgi:predicted RNA binding protein YcfA (HicA-like mRNA interferase family)